MLVTRHQVMRRLWRAAGALGRLQLLTACSLRLGSTGESWLIQGFAAYDLALLECTLAKYYESVKL